MRKLMVMVAMLAMMMVAAAPAFAQAVSGDVTVLDFNFDQVQLATAQQVGFGNATADTGSLGSASGASIDQGLWVSQAQFGF